MKTTLTQRKETNKPNWQSRWMIVKTEVNNCKENLHSFYNNQMSAKIPYPGIRTDLTE